MPTTLGPVMTHAKLTQIKGRDEKRWRVEDAVRTFKRKGEIDREIEEIKKDKPLLVEVEKLLQQEKTDINKAIKV